MNCPLSSYNGFNIIKDSDIRYNIENNGDTTTVVVYSNNGYLPANDFVLLTESARQGKVARKYFYDGLKTHIAIQPHNRGTIDMTQYVCFVAREKTLYYLRAQYLLLTDLQHRQFLEESDRQRCTPYQDRCNHADGSSTRSSKTLPEDLEKQSSHTLH